MGEWKVSINYHYSRENIHALSRIAEDSTVDEDDRLLAKQYAANLEKETIDRIDIHRMYQKREVEKLKQIKENPENGLSDKNKK